MVVGIIGLIFAVYEHWQRTKVEHILRDTLRRLAGVVRVVFSNANWADTHFRNIGSLLTDATPDLTSIRKRVLDGARDSASCARQLSILHSHIRGIQMALFKDAEETLPEIQSDDVKAAHSLSMGRSVGENTAKPQ